MQTPLQEALFRHRTLSIIGMGKNAGKTTVLGRLITYLSQDVRTAALTSIGRDGESVDIVTGTEKPGIWVHEGTLIATAADMLRLCDITIEVLHTTGMRTPLGEVVIVRALSDGQVQLAGPSMNDQLAQAVALLQSLGAETVLIDGAISRKSLASPTVSEATILCAGASYHPDMDTVVADTAHACRLLMLPTPLKPHAGQRVLGGAATDKVLEKLSLCADDEVVVRDSSCLLLSRAMMDRLTARGIRFSVQRPTTLCCVCINPFSATGADFDAALFLSRMRQAIPVPVINALEE